MILQRGGLIRFPEQKHIELLGEANRLPRIASIEDEEFENGLTLPAKWYSITPRGTVNYDYNQTYPSHLYVNLTNGATYPALTLYSLIPDSDFSITTCCYIWPRLTGTGIQWSFMDSAAKEGVGIRTLDASGRHYISALQRTSGTQSEVGTNFEIYRAEKIYLHLQKSGNTNERWWSTDGKSWILHYSSSKAWTPNKYYFQIYSTSTTAGHKFSAAVDWIRYNWITL